MFYQVIWVKEWYHQKSLKPIQRSFLKNFDITEKDKALQFALDKNNTSKSVWINLRKRGTQDIKKQYTISQFRRSDESLRIKTK